MLIDTVRRKLQDLSARRESGVAAYQLVQFLLGIRNFEQAKNIVIPKMIYQRILYGESRSEALEILSLLAEGLLRIEKFHDARKVAEKTLLGYNLRYGAKHPQTLQSQLRVARAVPLPNGNNN